MRRVAMRFAAAAAGGMTLPKTVDVPSREPLLFTPGPLQTSLPVKAAMLKDYGSRDAAFMQCIQDVRSGLLKVGGLSADTWTAVPMQGSGTMGLEATLRTITPSRADALVAVQVNGSYGKRLRSICEKIGLNVVAFETPEGEPLDMKAFQEFIELHAAKLTTFVSVHSETSTGMMNPSQELCDIVRKAAGPKVVVMLDAMSSYGGVVFNPDTLCDVLVSSSNKCIQGVPGFSVVLARKQLLQECEGRSTSFTLDVAMQDAALNKNGQFPFTPPVHSLMAFRQALVEFEAEGGVTARAKRYQSLADRTAEGMQALGFELFLNKSEMGHIITAYKTPAHPKWKFEVFNDRLREKGLVLYPGKASAADTFRIGSIGDLHLPDVEQMLTAIEETLQEQGIDLRLANKA